MAVKEQIYQIDGFIFYGKKEAEQAKKEAAGVEYLKAKIDKNQPEAVLSVYNKTVEENLFETPVGLSYMRELQQYLRKIPYIAEKDILPIPVKSGNDDTKPKEQKEKTDFKKRYQTLTVICALLVIMVVSMFAITLTSDSPTILDYEKKIVNRYEAWEQELDAREQELDAKTQK